MHLHTDAKSKLLSMIFYLQMKIRIFKTLEQNSGKILKILIMEKLEKKHIVDKNELLNLN